MNLPLRVSVAALLLLLSSACSSKPRWERFDPGNNTITVEFPGKPRCDNEEGGTVCRFSIERMRYRVFFFPQGKLPPVGKLGPGQVESTVDGARVVDGDTQDQSPPSFGRERRLRAGGKDILLEVMWSEAATLDEARAKYAENAASAERFFNSLKVLSPSP